jgi:hypothetical protein
MCKCVLRVCVCVCHALIDAHVGEDVGDALATSSCYLID